MAGRVRPGSLRALRILIASRPTGSATCHNTAGIAAYAVRKGPTASVDPEAWTIVDGKLYLNYSKGVKKRWEQDVPANIVKADKNWPDLHK